MEKTIIRCDECHLELEAFSELHRLRSCLAGRPHRSVRIARAA